MIRIPGNRGYRITNQKRAESSDLQTFLEKSCQSRRDFIAIALKKQKADYSKAYNEGFLDGDNNGYNRGHGVGLTEGEDIGLKKGEETGIEKGKQIGFEEGKNIGITRGKDEGFGLGMKTFKICLLC